jgi:hypothetical protein
MNRLRSTQTRWPWLLYRLTVLVATTGSDRRLSEQACICRLPVQVVPSTAVITTNTV